ncbi:unnamed protein product [Lampetra planeri]
METCQAVEMIRDEQATSTAAEVEAATAQRPGARKESALAQSSVSTEGSQLLGRLDVLAGLDRSATDIGEPAGQRAQTAKVNAEPASAEQHQERAGRRRGGPGAGFTPDRARRHNCVRVAFKEDVPEEVTMDCSKFVRTVVMENLASSEEEITAKLSQEIGSYPKSVQAESLLDLVDENCYSLLEDFSAEPD